MAPAALTARFPRFSAAGNIHQALAGINIQGHRYSEGSQRMIDR